MGILYDEGAKEIFVTFVYIRISYHTGYFHSKDILTYNQQTNAYGLILSIASVTAA